MLKVFFKKTTTIAHKFDYMNVCISMRINFLNEMSLFIFTSHVKFHLCCEIFFSNEISLFIFTSCAKFHFCCEIIFSNEILLLVICIHFSYKWEMGITKQMNIKSRTYYFYNDLINIKDFDPKLLKLDKKSYKNIETLIFITLDTLQKNEY